MRAPGGKRRGGAESGAAILNAAISRGVRDAVAAPVAAPPASKATANHTDGHNRRQWSRFFLPTEGDRCCDVRLGDSQAVPVDVLDVSMAGVRMRWPEARSLPNVGEQVVFGRSELTHWGEVLANAQGYVRWVRGREVGVLLITPLCAAARQRATP